MTFVNFLLGIVAAVLLLFVLGKTDPPMTRDHRVCVTVAFVAVVALIIALNIIY